MSGGGDAQGPPVPNPTTVQWHDLPHVFFDTSTPPNHDWTNFRAADLEVIESTLGTGRDEVFRLAYATTGELYEAPNGDLTLFGGQLRYVDVPVDVPDLSDDNAWSALSVTSLPPVANWNQVFENAGLPLEHSKRIPLVGMISSRTQLFVCGSSRNERAYNMAGTAMLKTPWNGLSTLNAAASPASAFDPRNGVGQELYSAGTGAFSPGGLRRAVPEGTTIRYVPQPYGVSGTFLFTANYCGDEAAGHLLVQDISDQTNIDPDERILVPLYELLADWLVGPDSPPAGPLGHEVDRSWFTCPLDTNGFPQCGSGIITPDKNTLKGNKLRSTVTFTTPDDGIPEGDPGDAEDDNRTFVVAVLNLDPIALPSEYGAGGAVPVSNIPLDSREGCPPYTPSNTVTRDDGKYDYLCLVDITDMYSVANTDVGSLPVGWPPAHKWRFDVQSEWASRVRFVRIPPDVPDGWTYTSPNPIPLNSGHDFSEVTIYRENEVPSGSTTSTTATIVGSGTLKSMAASPDGRYLYLVASDQGQENVAENDGLTDGGFHVPHLYVIDLTQGNLEDQAALNTAFSDPTSGFIRSYRFNKVVSAGCTSSLIGDGGCAAPICATEPMFQGVTVINSTIPGFPTTGWPDLSGDEAVLVTKGNEIIPAVGLTALNGIPLADVGAYHPGEHQADPTARTRLQIFENGNLAGPYKTRMYVGTTGFSQAPNEIFNRPRMGGVFSIGLDAVDGTPQYLASLTIEQNVDPDPTLPVPAFDPDQHWSIGGLDYLAPSLVGGIASRNVLAIIATHARQIDNAPQDRLFLVEDT